MLTWCDRSIFRWITVKNLNTMEFDEGVTADTPLGLLRGIKHGTESYHVLFKRLCSKVSFEDKYDVVCGGIGCHYSLKTENTETLTLMNEAYEDEKLSRTQVYFWYKRFKDGRKSIADDSRSGQPLTSSTDRYIGQWKLLHDNAPAHRVIIVQGYLAKPSVPVLPHLPFTPDIAPCDFFFFPKLKMRFKGRRFSSSSEVIENATVELNKLRKIDFELAFQQLFSRWKKYVTSKRKELTTPVGVCSYAGLHCTVIKGYSKSAGYQPGVRFTDQRFRNSWNAVYVAGGWRFVQCNWGARHLVNAREVPRGAHEGLRYEYDDHYFLTDPRDFIHEFFPLQPEWQLLEEPLTLRNFEDLPFVRSLFFRYRLYFPGSDTRATLTTDGTGAATVTLGVPKDLAASLIFHYNLRFFDSDCDQYEGVSLKRYVMQSADDEKLRVSFRVHAPCSGALLLDLFANAVTPREYLAGDPMKFKSVAKFKILCNDLQAVMVPLPDCASGEWGPSKARRLFGMIPLGPSEPLVVSGMHDLVIPFRMTRSLTDFMAAMVKNGCDERCLARRVSHTVEKEIVTFRVNFPEAGQYGLDIYTREVTDDDPSHDRHLLTHCCKFLINVVAD
ncbi:Hil [Cordylochernes scorpioides]|uniref:Hil n=1 Tax=Cordylochernes scorpioides TaxID=51811 RepID=A0ABY6KC30_9ARAC|nr:Hil [Cordylochernes scorpioides]